ncbi:uncharacterized protein LOC110627899 [Manihot esculenta]|uniref:Aspartate/glutamate/uridylate kinase domain-containing protein n=1 Tax=Manihot esculenta TaxID=3983 RepID=A0A2C9UVR3_MANES|nr:uncharacterized protein LOC110627899 [Manihot esculenta]OAY35609.2 hypothetical protein MANES_12G100611v8 [Manihot esculenta]
MKVKCIHCRHQLGVSKIGATTHFLRHLNSFLRRKMNLKGQQQLNITTTITETESVTSVKNFKYDHTKKASHAIASKYCFSAYEIEKKKVKALMKDTNKIVAQGGMQLISCYHLLWSLNISSLDISKEIEVIHICLVRMIGKRLRKCALFLKNLMKLLMSFQVIWTLKLKFKLTS